MTETEDISAESCKDKGNEAVKNKKYEEAVLHYTRGIKIDPRNHLLFSNRSLAFLKLHQHALAYEDAIETIKLNPTWPKGYFRKAEIEYEVCRYSDAIDSYALALRYAPEDVHIYESLQKAKKARLTDLKADEQVPWVCCGLGLILGVVLVIADYCLAENPTHPILMAVITIVIAMIGYGIGKGYRAYVRNQREAMFDIASLLENESAESEQTENGKTEKNAPRYTKSQARQRYKKGKM